MSCITNGVKCDVCGETFYYDDEIFSLDCNGDYAFDEENGGSGDTYGNVCSTCYEEYVEEISESISKYGKIILNEVAK